jgi:tripartite-type tricarboxylate transporter receptor subunit TctC
LQQKGRNMKKLFKPTTTTERALNPTRRMTGLSLLALLATAFLPIETRSGYAQSYPERPIKIVVPFPAGGPTDVAARLAAQSLTSRLGQNVVVENMAGAGGRIGTKAVAEAKPDGYTLLLGGTNVNAVAAWLYSNPGFDPVKSFVPVATLTVDFMALAISPRVPAGTFEQFVQHAKQNPGKLSYGAPPGIYIHYAAEFFKAKTGTDILFVPYKGATPMITDLLGGHIDMLFNNRSTLLTHFKAGKLKALAVTSEARWPELPNTPTMKEVGIIGFPREVIFGLLAPVGTSTIIVDKLNRAVNEGLTSADARAMLAKIGMEARSGTAQEFAVALAAQVREWKSVVDATNIKVD